MKIKLLIIVAIFVVFLPWLQEIDVGTNNEVMIDGITTSATIAMILTLVFSLLSWFLFSWAAKNIRLWGIPLGIISGASIVIPFLQVLGPMAAVMVGLTGGFVAFMLQKKMIEPAKNRPIVIAGITLAVAYFVLTMVVLAAQGSHIWDTGDGIGAWTGTAEGLEKKGFDNIFANNIGFAFFFVIIPALVAIVWIIGNKKPLGSKLL